MKKVLFATRNQGKVRELAALFADRFEVVGLDALGIAHEVVEDEPTFEGNARKKASELARLGACYALADDSGLEVDALDGAPGVRSARYAHEKASDRENVEALLAALRDVPAPRRARFRCVLALASEEGEILHVAHGVCEGAITTEVRGEGGFGYDPVFVPEGDTRTMAELSPAEKAAISHRGEAARALHALLARG